jgi:hypothetical protein
MTNDNTMTGGVVTTTLTSVVTTTTPDVAAVLKRTLRNPPKQEVVVFEDAVLVAEEDKLLLQEDEEITSVESNEVDIGDDDDMGDEDEAENDVEQALFTVALVKSLEPADLGGPSAGPAPAAASASLALAPTDDDGSKHRLRKRRRRFGQDTDETGDDVPTQSAATTGDGGTTLVAPPRDSRPPPLALIPSTLTPPLGLVNTTAAATAAAAATVTKRNVRIKTEKIVSSRLLRSGPSAAVAASINAGRQRLPSISETSVPNPLLNDIPSTIEDVSMILPSKIKKEDSTDSFFPCPMSHLSDEPASISVETPIASADGSRKVNFTADTSSMTSNQRMRGLSIDFDCTFVSLWSCSILERFV